MFGKMEKVMRENGETASFTAKESRLFPTVQYLMGTGKKVDLLVKECVNIQMVQNTQAAGSTDNLTELV